MKITPAYYYLTAAAKVGLAVLSLLLIFLFNYCHISHPIMMFVSYALAIVSALIVPFFFLMIFLEHKNDDQLSIVSLSIVGFVAVLVIFRDLIYLFQNYISIPSIFYRLLSLSGIITMYGVFLEIIAVLLLSKIFIKKYNLILPVVVSCVLLILSFYPLASVVSRWIPNLIYSVAFAFLMFSYGKKREQVGSN